MLKVICITCVMALLVSCAQQPQGYAYCDQLISQSRDTTVNVEEFDWQTLYRQFNYLAMLDKYRLQLANSEVDSEIYSWAGEAALILAELETNDRDIQSVSRVAILNEDKNDRTKADLEYIQKTIGPEFWSEDVAKKYGNFSLCVIQQIRKEHPQHSGLYTREMAIKIAMGRIDEVERELLAVTQEQINPNKDMGEYLAMFAERFVGYQMPVRAAHYIKALHTKHNLHESEIERWQKIINLAIHQSQKPKKEALLTEVVEIFKPLLADEVITNSVQERE